MSEKDLKSLQLLPLSKKVELSKQCIREYIEKNGKDRVYGSLSGGMGSTVLYFLTKEVEPEIPFVFINTRNEYPEIVRHVYLLKGQNNEKYGRIMKNYTPYNDARNQLDTIEIRLPSKQQREVLKEGYLVASKQVTRQIADVRSIMKQHPDDYWKMEKYRSHLDSKNLFSIPNRFQYLINAPFPISNACCKYLKQEVFAAYSRETGRNCCMTGEQASESRNRRRAFLKFGASGEGRKKPKATPLGFWSTSDLLNFARTTNMPYATCYGEIKSINGKLVTTGEQRTGCICCTAGVCQECGKNRFQRLRECYPKHYSYMMKPLEEGGLGMEQVLKWLNVSTDTQEELSLEELLELFENVC